MQVQVNSNQIVASASVQDWVSAAVGGRLDRFEDFLTRVEVHLSDENAKKAGADDKRCQIEVRPKGHQPLSVTHKSESMNQAVDGAAEKMRHALEHLMGRLDAKSVSSGHLADPLLGEEPEQVTDALLQEEFLAKQEALGKD
jgi:ribosomal subunit interface protein